MTFNAHKEEDDFNLFFIFNLLRVVVKRFAETFLTINVSEPGTVKETSNYLLIKIIIYEQNLI